MCEACRNDGGSLSLVSKKGDLVSKEGDLVSKVEIFIIDRIY